VRGATIAAVPAPVPSPLAPRRPGLLARLLAAVRRASAAIYRALVLALLAVAYVVVLPWFAAIFRLRARRTLAAPAWRPRDDPGLASVDRLRSLF
jgi:hypothetical protein